MFYALSWFVVLMLLALWSLAAWALNAVTVWTLSNAGVLADTVPGVDALGLPAWLAPWVPPEAAGWLGAAMSTLGQSVEWLLQAMPSLAGGVSVMVWVVWGLGSGLLLLLGAGLHLLIAMWRRGSDSPPAGGAGPLGAVFGRR